jgi:hypothetical protein
MVHVYIAICYFFLGMYKEADEEARKGSNKHQNNLSNVVDQHHLVNFKIGYFFMWYTK